MARTWSARVLGFAILLYVVINANVAAQTLGFVWLGDRRRASWSSCSPPVAARTSCWTPSRLGDAPMSAPGRAGRLQAASRDDWSLTPSAAGSPLLTVAPGTISSSRTEDCFGGAVRGVDDLPSEVCTFPYLNPVTGPFAVRGRGARATPSPCTSWRSARPGTGGCRATFPHFGALTTTHATAMLHPALEERVWRYEIDRRRRHLPVPRPATATSPWTCRSTRCTAPSASRRRPARC